MEAQKFIDYHYLNHAKKREKAKRIVKQITYRKKRRNFSNNKCID